MAVVLPAPLGPKRQNISPGCRVSEKSTTAGCSPKYLDSACACNIALGLSLIKGGKLILGQLEINKTDGRVAPCSENGNNGLFI